MDMMDAEHEIRARFDKAGQAHVFQYMNDLSPAEKEDLLKQLSTVPVEKIASLHQAALAEQHGSTDDIEPFSGPIGRSSDKLLVDTSYETGMDAIRVGQVASLVLAGGQGTRLGFDGPKGFYDIGLPSGRSLFQLIAERIQKLSLLAGKASIPFYIMTSPLNHDQTVKYFETKDFFGLGKSNVYFFQQGMLPCLTKEGKIILEARNKVAMAPDGNGGIYPSLQQSGALQDMKSRGVKYVHVFSIDNALVKPADPILIGYCINQKADCGNKVVWKSHAHEKVGVVAMRQHKPCIVEYSEITSEMAERTDDQGRLVFGAGNICNHFYTVEFIQDKILPNMGNLYHIAHKKIPYYDDEAKQIVTPTANNGIKLETFIFDVFPYSERMAVLDVGRSEEFSPVKNKAGSPSDSADTARKMISDLAKQWVTDAGAKLVGTVDDSICEVAPLTSYAGEGLESFKDIKLECPFSI